MAAAAGTGVVALELLLIPSARVTGVKATGATSSVTSSICTLGLRFPSVSRKEAEFCRPSVKAAALSRGARPSSA